LPDIFAYLSGYISFFPLVAFVCLLLAGLNVPMSEDLIIITGALLCEKDSSILAPTLAALYAGVIISDFMVFWIGTRIRRGVSKSKIISRVLTPVKLHRMRRYLDRFGIFTFIVCRFIPFGVRNTLFMASGILRLRARVFALYDITAAAISVNTLFFLVYFLGEDIQKPFKTAGKVLFFVLASTVVVIVFRLVSGWRKAHRRRALSQPGAGPGGLSDAAGAPCKGAPHDDGKGEP
jgi:membrane protein DedA with SNARE-associated domain